MLFRSEGNTIFGEETRSDGAYIVELNASTGQVIAQHRIDAFNPQPTPTVVNGHIVRSIRSELPGFFAMLVNPDITYVISPGGRLLALNNATGKQIWSAQLITTSTELVSFALSE